MEWQTFLEEEKQKEYFKKLMDKVCKEYEEFTCYPLFDYIFNAYNTRYDDVKCLILGQDPYINEGEAHGYAFSVYNHTITKTLKNIYQEMQNDLGCETLEDGDLSYLAKEGVMLLNTILTVRAHESLSHKNFGWEILTDNTIKALNEREKPLVFILWGNDARKKRELITNQNHLIIESSHPSPLGAYRSFFGSKPFSRTNEFLISNNIEPINWIKNKRDLFNN